MLKFMAGSLCIKWHKSGLVKWKNTHLVEPVGIFGLGLFLAPGFLCTTFFLLYSLSQSEMLSVWGTP